MRKQFTRLLLLVVLFSSLLLSQVFLVDAQKLESPLAQATPSKEVVSIDATQVPFRIIQEEIIPLSGPYDSTYFAFAIPNTWALSPGAQLYLDMTVNFNQVFSSEFGYPLVTGGGTLSVYMNNTLLGVLNLNEVGDVQVTLPLPLEAFVSNRDDGRMAFYAELDASDFCYVDEDFTLFIHPTSYLSLPHEIVRPVPNIIELPNLLYQNTFVQESALIVIPDQPSADELQAAITVAAGLGSFSRDDLPLDVTTISALTPEQQISNHLLLVGKPASFGILGELALPARPVGGKFQLSTEVPDAGVIQLVNSPWDVSRMVVLVSGNSDAGVIKAAQAFSTGVLRPNRQSNLAVIENVQSAQTGLLPASVPETRTLASMGYQNSVFKFRGFNAATYGFQMPLGWTVAEDAYFELAYGHSALVDYEQSGITVLLNDNPIGSIRFDPATAENAINKVKIDIPQTAIVPGLNQLDVQAFMFPNDICAPPDVQSLWISIWNESVLSLPIVQQQADMSTAIDLADYPAPFVFDFELSKTAFVLPQNGVEAWRGAAKIASYLASQANPSIVTLSAFYGDDFPPAMRKDYHVVVIGRPSQLPVVDELNQTLPVPFEPGSDKANEGNLRVIFNIPEDASLGYVELLVSPWNPENIVIALLGNSPQGEMWAASALSDPDLRSQISGNFVIVNDRQILASDTRVFPVSEADPAVDDEAPVAMMTPDPDMTPAPLPQGQNWIPLVMMIGAGLILLIIIGVLVSSFLQRRSRA
ncbi:MAG: hypothetical protein Kow002_12590 [Anaerolineales bacterium]